MKVAIFGDFSGYTNQFSDYFDNNGLPVLFGDLLPVLEEHDLNIYHQEFPLTKSDRQYSAKLSGPFIKCNPKAAACLGKAGFHVATFASNHTLNYGETGLYDTINNLTRVGIDVIGAGNTKEKAKEPYFYEKDGIKICILNYAETQFNLATDDHGGANPLDIIDNVGDIKKCKELVDHVIVIIHGGPDFCPYPSPRMVKQYRFYIDSGASAVINHHQHVVAGYEAYNGKPIFYGIGSVVPGKIIVPGCKEGLGISLNIQKDNIAWEIIPLRFNLSQMRQEVLTGEHKKEFMDNLEEVSVAITDPIELKKKYGGFLDQSWMKTDYIVSFSGFSRLPFRIAKKLGVDHQLSGLSKYNSFKKKARHGAFWNLIRCETHQDALRHYFESDIDT